MANQFLRSIRRAFRGKRKETQGQANEESTVRAPIELFLYDEDSEPIKYLSRSIIPWGLLKKAVRLQENGKDPAENIDAMTSLVMEVFDEQVKRAELERYADVGDMVNVVMAIVNRAKAVMPENPTRPGTIATPRATRKRH